MFGARLDLVGLPTRTEGGEWSTLPPEVSSESWVQFELLEGWRERISGELKGDEFGFEGRKSKSRGSGKSWVIWARALARARRSSQDITPMFVLMDSDATGVLRRHWDGCCPRMFDEPHLSWAKSQDSFGLPGVTLPNNTSTFVRYKPKRKLGACSRLTRGYEWPVRCRLLPRCRHPWSGTGPRCTGSSRDRRGRMLEGRTITTLTWVGSEISGDIGGRTPMCKASRWHLEIS